MARQKISLVSDDVKREVSLESRIRSGEINPDNFKDLSEEEQYQVNAILFKIASNEIEPNHGVSTLEFIMFAFMRIMMKKVNGLSLSADEKEIEQSLQNIMNMHQITNTKVRKSDWLFDYMGYAEAKSQEFLANRERHIERKKNTTGIVGKNRDSY